MSATRLAVILTAVIVCAAVWAQAADEELPRCRKYNVQHPVYSWDHSVWNLVRTSEQADDWADMSSQELRSHIDDVEYRSGDNSKMVGALKVLAQKYGESGDDKYAYKAAVILHRYSEVLKHWGWYDRISQELKPHDYVEPAWGWMMPPRYAGMWSSWHPYDLHRSAPLVLAYDQIYESGQIEKLGQELGIADMKLHLERELLYYNLSIDDRYPLSYGNTEANRQLGMLTWGQALGDPELVHRAIRFGDGLIKISYFPSAFWHEGSPCYHQMITGRWAAYGMMPQLDAYSDPPGYVDPVDGTRFDNADLRARYQPFLEKAARAMQKFVWPNGYYAAINDSHWESNTTERWDCYGILDEYKPEESEPTLLTWAGHAILGQGRGDDQVQARLNFGGTYGHDHLDRLNFFLWAKNIEIISETDYQAHGHRGWGSATAGHNTVVIDEQNQFHRSSAAQREFTPVDEVAVEDFDWARKTVKHGSTLTDGQLRLFATDGPNGLQVIEVDGQRSYPAEICQLYRRTICMVQSSGPDVYFVDIFRVRGGSTHDWMLHGPLQNEYTIDTSVSLQPREGKLHGWIENLRSASTDDQWSVTFTADTGQKVRTIVLGAENTEVIIGDAPAMRREGTAQFLDVRRQGPENIFVAVHEPYTDEPKVQSVKLTSLSEGSEMAVAVQVELADRTDYILSALDSAGAVKFEGLDFTGHLAYLSRSGDDYNQAYMVDASVLQFGEDELEGVVAYEGKVLRTLGTDMGAEINAFVSDADLPADSRLRGRLLLTEDGDGSTRGFFIETVERGSDGEKIIQIDRLPGMTVEDGYVKLQYFPNWGIPGELKLKIVNSAVLR